MGNAAGTIGHLLTAPLRWDRDDLMIAGGILGVTALSVAVETDMHLLMQRNQSSFNDMLEPIGYDYGAPQYAGVGAIGVYVVGVIADNHWIRQTGLMLCESMATVGLIQIPARIIAGRARPSADEGHASFMPFKGSQQPHASFISGHAAIAFASSTVLAHQIDNIWATVGLYSLATLTPYVRLYKDAHWLSDAFFGSALGVAVGSAVIAFHRDNHLLGGHAYLLPTEDGVMLTVMF